MFVLVEVVKWNYIPLEKLTFISSIRYVLLESGTLWKGGGGGCVASFISDLEL